MIKIAISGPESSGKTTLTKALALDFNSPFAEEYARIHLENNPNYSQEDLEIMAKGQLALWSKLPQSQIRFYDTEFMVFKIWSEEKYNSCSPLIENELKNQRFDLYFICSPDIPWEYDPLRENELDRDQLFEKYIALATKMKYPFKVLEGSHPERLATAIREVEKILSTI